MSNKIYDRKFNPRAEARSLIADYVELFYSYIRLHSTLGYKSPKEFKKDYYNSINKVA